MSMICSTCYATASRGTADEWQMRNGAWFCPLHVDEDDNDNEEEDVNETETADVKVGYVLVPQIAADPVVKLGYILAVLPDGQIIKAIAETSRGAEALITELLNRRNELWAYEGMLPVGLVDIREAPEEFEINQEFIELMLLTMDEMDERARDEDPYEGEER